MDLSNFFINLNDSNEIRVTVNPSNVKNFKGLPLSSDFWVLSKPKEEPVIEMTETSKGNFIKK